MVDKKYVAPAWSPTVGSSHDAVVNSFMSWVRDSVGISFADYNELWVWSVSDLPAFWFAVWEFFGIRAQNPPTEILTTNSMPGAVWFPGTMLNFAENVLCRGDGSDVAILTVGEENGAAARELSRSELRHQVGALAATLSELGVGPGDRVVGYLPNIAEAVIALLASATLGAIWSCLGQDYGSAAVIERFQPLDPKVLIGADGYRYGGQAHDRRVQTDEIRGALPTVRATIMVQRLGMTGSNGNEISWEDAVSNPCTRDPIPVDFDHPLWIVFSSGATGPPKGIVHGHGGITIEHFKLLGLHYDLRPGDRFFWFTSTSWSMWNISVSALLRGASILCYDGSPNYPDGGALWRLAADYKATIFGSSPGYLAASQKAKFEPSSIDLSSLRILGSTGSPLPASVSRWLGSLLPDIPVFSQSGGTDVATAFAAGVPIVPVWPGELSVRCLGVAMECWNENGLPLLDEVGELVVTEPMPSMPVEFWADPDGTRYRDAYFEKFPNTWRHGDAITITGRGSVIIHGRSDSTLNRNGIRIGSAEIYGAIEAMPEIAEGLVVGVEGKDDEYWMPLFIVLSKGNAFDSSLTDRIAEQIRSRLSPRHIPDDIIAVPGIPHTRTGKKLEVPIKQILQGKEPSEVVALGSVDDPSLLYWYAKFGEWHRSIALSGGAVTESSVFVRVEKT